MAQTLFQTLGGGSDSPGIITPNFYVSSRSTTVVPARIDVVFNRKIIAFGYDENTAVYAQVIVPQSYVEGTQIFLRRGKMFCANLSSGNFLIRTTTVILRDGESATGLGSRNSTNTQQSVPASAFILGEVDEIDITDADGEIQSQPVQPGDMLAIQLFRAVSTETSGVQDEALILDGSFEVIFT